MRHLSLVLLVSIDLLLLLLPVCAVSVTEVLPNPPGDDNNKEYVEFLTTFPLNATFVFSDGDSNDTLRPVVTLGDESAAHTLLLIVEEGHNVTLLNESFTLAHEDARCIVFTAGATIGNNLENTGDELLLWADGTPVVSSAYAVPAGSCADGFGCSLANDGEGWRLVNATPCLLDTPAFDEVNLTTTDPPAGNITTNSSDDLVTNVTEGTLNGTMPGNVTLNTTLNGSIDMDLAGNLTTNVSANQTNATTNVSMNESMDAMNLSTNLTTNLSINLASNVTTNISATVNSSLSMNVTIPNALNLTNATQNASVTSCAYVFDLWTNAEHLDEGDSLSFQPQLVVENRSLSRLAYSFAYWFVNEDGDLVRDRASTTNTNKKSFTPRCTRKECEYTLTVQLVSLSCAPQASATREWVFTAEGTPAPITAAAQPVKVAAKAALPETLDVLAEQDTLSAAAPSVVDGDFVMNVTLWNEGYSDALFVVWAYVYRTSQNYSVKDVTSDIIVPPREETALSLRIVPHVPAPGDYKVKVRALAPWRTTPYEVTLPITFVETTVVAAGAMTAFSNASTVSTSSLRNSSASPPRAVTGSAVAALPSQSSFKRFLVEQGAWLSVALVAILWGASTLLKRRPPIGEKIDFTAAPPSL